MVKITISDLVYINEAAKALKQSQIIYISNYIVGLSDIKTCLSRVELSPEHLSQIQLIGFIFNQKELSAFIKAVTTESEIEINELLQHNMVYSTYGAVSLTIEINYNVTHMVNTMIDRFKNMQNYMSIETDESSNLIDTLSSMIKTSGAYYYKYMNKYFMTLIKSSIPVAKKDSIYIRVYDPNDSSHIFYAQFRIKKPKFNVYINMAFINTI